MTDTEKIAERFLNILKPKCPYCDADVTYAYYGYDGERYCPKCHKELKGDVE